MAGWPAAPQSVAGGTQPPGCGRHRGAGAVCPRSGGCAGRASLPLASSRDEASAAAARPAFLGATAPSPPLGTLIARQRWSGKKVAGTLRQ